MLSVEIQFLESCSSWNVCSLEDGRILYFWSGSEQGGLDVFLCYLDPHQMLSHHGGLQAHQGWLDVLQDFLSHGFSKVAFPQMVSGTLGP